MLLNRLRCLIPNLLTSYTHIMWNDCIDAVQVKREHTSSLPTRRFFADPLPTDVHSSWMKSYCNEGQVIVLYLAPLLFCTLCSGRELYTILSEVLIFFSRVSPFGGVGAAVQCELTVRMYLPLPCLQMQENVKNTLNLLYLICTFHGLCQVPQ